MIETLLGADSAAVPTSFSVLALSLLMSFLIGQAISWVYMLTHTGLSYSRAFVVSLVVMPVVVSLVMMVLSNNLVTAFGLMAVFAIVRFRNVLRDTLDTAYVLGVVVLGMACGTQKYSTALLGALVVAGIMVYVWSCEFGSRRRFDFILSFTRTAGSRDPEMLAAMLKRHCLTAECVHKGVSHDGNETDFSYQVRLRDPERSHDLIQELAECGGITKVSGTHAEMEAEP